jgi:hypothetical protein
MAGRTPLPARDTPDVRWGVFTANFPASTHLVNQPLFYCEKDTVIDYASVRFTANGGSGATMTLEKCSSGTAAGSGTAFTSALDVGATATENVNTPFTLTQTQNVVSGQTYSGVTVTAGQWVSLKVAGTATPFAGACLYVRYHTLVN